MTTFEAKQMNLKDVQKTNENVGFFCFVYYKFFCKKNSLLEQKAKMFTKTSFICKDDI